MANSSLTEYRNMTKNNGGKRVSKIMGITPHYMADAGNFDTLNGCADYFVACYAQGRRASSNYCVGGGKVAVSVDEDYHAWTSANWDNDDTHVTIEVSNLNNSTGEISDRNYKTLISLCADICKRHGITPHYNKSAGVKSTITMHKDVSTAGSTSCPGAWLSNKITSGQFEKDILTAMGQSTSTTTTTTTSASTNTSSAEIYRVRKTWADSKTQIGAYKVYANAVAGCKAGYSVYDSKGTKLYSVTSDGTKWDYDAVLKTGDTVKSKSCAIAVISGTDSAIEDDCVYVPELGGLVPLADVNESADTGDGKQDDYLATVKAKVYLAQCKVTDVDASKNLVKIKGAGSGEQYWVIPDKLGKKLN